MRTKFVGRNTEYERVYNIIREVPLPEDYTSTLDDLIKDPYFLFYFLPEQICHHPLKSEESWSSWIYYQFFNGLFGPWLQRAIDAVKPCLPRTSQVGIAMAIEAVLIAYYFDCHFGNKDIDPKNKYFQQKFKHMLVELMTRIRPKMLSEMGLAIISHVTAEIFASEINFLNSIFSDLYKAEPLQIFYSYEDLTNLISQYNISKAPDKIEQYATKLKDFFRLERHNFRDYYMLWMILSLGQKDAYKLILSCLDIMEYCGEGTQPIQYLPKVLIDLATNGTLPTLIKVMSKDRALDERWFNLLEEQIKTNLECAAAFVKIEKSAKTPFVRYIKSKELPLLEEVKQKIGQEQEAIALQKQMAYKVAAPLARLSGSHPLALAVSADPSPIKQAALQAKQSQKSKKKSAEQPKISLPDHYKLTADGLIDARRYNVSLVPTSRGLSAGTSLEALASNPVLLFSRPPSPEPTKQAQKQVPITVQHPYLADFEKIVQINNAICRKLDQTSDLFCYGSFPMHLSEQLPYTGDMDINITYPAEDILELIQYFQTHWVPALNAVNAQWLKEPTFNFDLDYFNFTIAFAYGHTTIDITMRLDEPKLLFWLPIIKSSPQGLIIESAVEKWIIVNPYFSRNFENLFAEPRYISFMWKMCPLFDQLVYKNNYESDLFYTNLKYQLLAEKNVSVFDAAFEHFFTQFFYKDVAYYMTYYERMHKNNDDDFVKNPFRMLNARLNLNENNFQAFYDRVAKNPEWGNVQEYWKRRLILASKVAGDPLKSHHSKTEVISETLACLFPDENQLFIPRPVAQAAEPENAGMRPPL